MRRWLVLVLMYPAAGHCTAVGANSDLQADNARFMLQLAVDEIEACCAGDVARADWDAQRRWAYSLYRWTVLSAGWPRWHDLAGRDVLEQQVGKVAPTYAAAVAIHSRRWLEAQGPGLLVRPWVPLPLDQFTAEVYLYGLNGLDRLRAFSVYEREIQAAQAKYDAEVRKTGLAQDALGERIARALTRGTAIDHDLVLGPRRDQLRDAIRDRRARIRRVRKSWFEYKRDYDARASQGNLDSAVDLAEYKRVADSYSSEILTLTDEILELSERRSVYSSSGVAETLADIEHPPATRPVR